MPEISPDPAHPTAPAPAPKAPSPVASAAPKRNLGFWLLGGFFGLFVLIVVAAALLSAGGSSSVLVGLGIPADNVRNVVFNFINTIYFLAGIAALIALLIGGFRSLTALGDPREARRGRKTLLVAGGAMLFLILSYILLHSILPPATEVPGKLAVKVSQKEGPAPLNVRFSVESPYRNISQYAWDFGDGTATGPSADHTFTKPGTYTVKLAAILQGKTIDSISTPILVTAVKPDSRILALPKIDGPAPLAVNFDGTSSIAPQGATIVAWAWDFNDPASTEKNPATAEGARVVHVFTKEGQYQVKLVVTDRNGETGEATQQITVGASKDAPVAHISTSPPLADGEPGEPAFVRGTIPFQVSFSSAGSTDPDGTIVGYSWFFADGTAADRGKNVSHLFPRAGTYLVELTVTDGDGTTDTEAVRVFAEAPKKAPIAKVEAIPPAPGNAIVGAAPLNVAFSGAGSTDEDGTVVDYQWDFGDGTRASGERVEHTYAKAGDYFAKLVVVDDTETASAPVTLRVRVNTPQNQKPIAAFSTAPSPPTGNVPLTVTFDGSASKDADGSIVAYDWSFGNGKRVQQGEAKVTHIYEVPGQYTARLTVTDTTGLTDSTTLIVVVREPAPVAKIEVNRTRGASPLLITFNAAGSTGNLTSYEWTFGDGQTATGRRVDHTYLKPGFYTATLVVKDVHGLVAQESIQIEAD